MTPRTRRGLLPRRGCNKPAQGNALGSLFNNFSQALKGRNRETPFVPPFQGSIVSSRRCPRALPWAGLLLPLRGVTAHVLGSAPFFARLHSCCSCLAHRCSPPILRSPMPPRNQIAQPSARCSNNTPP